MLSFSRRILGSKMPWSELMIVFMLWLGTLLVALDVAIIGVALPKISMQFHAIHDVSWYVSAYLLTLTALQPFFGQLDKYFAPKLLYLCSIGLFEAGSTICGVAQTSHVFIVGRAIAGLGAAGIYQGAFAVITAVFPREKRSDATGSVMSVFLLALSFGPPLGGAMISAIGWRWCFFINLPIGGVISLPILLFLNIPNDPDNQPFERSLPFATKLSQLDFLGLTFLFGACVCLFLALQWGLAFGDWKSARIVGLFVGAVAFTLVFITNEWYLGDDAMLPLSVFGQRSILMACAFLCFSQASSYMLDTYLPFFFQDYQGVSTTISGARFFILVGPQVISLVLTAAQLVPRGIKLMIPMVLGQMIASVGLAMFIFKGMEPNAHASVWAPCLAFTGVGIGMGVAIAVSIPNAVFTDPRDSRIALANGSVNFMGELGAAIGIQIGQIIFLQSGGTADVRVATQHALYPALGAALLALLVAFHVGRLRIQPISEQQRIYSAALASQISLVAMQEALNDICPPSARIIGNVHELKRPSRRMTARALTVPYGLQTDLAVARLHRSGPYNFDQFESAMDHFVEHGDSLV